MAAITEARPVPEIPSDPGACADLLYETREKRLAIMKTVAELELLEKTLKDYFINNLSKSSGGAVGKTAIVQTENKIIPVVKDWDKLYAYIKKKGAFYLLQRRLTESAINDMWAGSKEVPGVEPFTTVKVSCTKR